MGGFGNLLDGLRDLGNLDNTNDIANMEANLRANLDRHEAYMHYLHVDYPKYLQEHIRKEFERQKQTLLEKARQEEMNKNEERIAADTRHTQVMRMAIASLVVAIVAVLISLLK